MASTPRAPRSVPSPRSFANPALDAARTVAARPRAMAPQRRTVAAPRGYPAAAAAASRREGAMGAIDDFRGAVREYPVTFVAATTFFGFLLGRAFAPRPVTTVVTGTTPGVI